MKTIPVWQAAILAAVLFFAALGLGRHMANTRAAAASNKSDRAAIDRMGGPVTGSLGTRRDINGQDCVYLPGIYTGSDSVQTARLAWVPLVTIEAVEGEKVIAIACKSIEYAYVIFESGRAVEVPRHEVPRLVEKRFTDTVDSTRFYKSDP